MKNRAKTAALAIAMLLGCEVKLAKPRPAWVSCYSFGTLVFEGQCASVKPFGEGVRCELPEEASATVVVRGDCVLRYAQ